MTWTDNDIDLYMGFPCTRTASRLQDNHRFLEALTDVALLRHTLRRREMALEDEIRETLQEDAEALGQAVGLALEEVHAGRLWKILMDAFTGSDQNPDTNPVDRKETLRNLIRQEQERQERKSTKEA